MNDHALFPPQDDEEAPDVERIHVTRLERGALVWCPRVFTPEELPDLKAVHELFGGGTYELIARSTASGRNVISARRRYTIPGAPRPLAEESHEDVEPSPAPAAAMPSIGGGGLWPTIIALAPALLQAWVGSQEKHTAMMMTMMNQSQQMLLAMVQSQKQDSQSFVQAMARLNESEKATMAQFFSKLAEAKTGGGGGDIEALMAGLELGTTMAGKGAGEGEGELGQIAQLLGSLAQLQASNQAAPAAPAAVPSQPSAPPSTPTPQG